MADDPTSDLNADRFTKLFEQKQRQSKTGLATRRSIEAQAHQPIDGRVSSTVNKRGFVQLNVRIPLDLKNQVLEVRNQRRGTGSAACDVGDIVADALRAYFDKPA